MGRTRSRDGGRVNPPPDGIPVLRDVDRLAAALGGEALQLAGAGDVIGIPLQTAGALQLAGPIAPWGSQRLVLLDPQTAAAAIELDESDLDPMPF